MDHKCRPCKASVFRTPILVPVVPFPSPTSFILGFTSLLVTEAKRIGNDYHKSEFYSLGMVTTVVPQTYGLVVLTRQWAATHVPCPPSVLPNQARTLSHLLLRDTLSTA